MLNELASAISRSDANAIVIIGDFNLAPRSEDGLFGDQTSTLRSGVAGPLRSR
jgi:endonuclease/exonuclease/phosphatase family metal-dependent hydrolase